MDALLHAPQPPSPREVASAEPMAVHVAQPERRGHRARHAAPSPVWRAAAAAVRAGRRFGDQARVGLGNLRSAVAAGPAAVGSPDAGTPSSPPAPSRLTIAPPSGLDDLRREFEERELELVAAGKHWSALAHRSYGELRFLPAAVDRPGRSRQVIEIDDADWEAPTWQTLGQR
jgi:hypothetical protein